MEILQCQLCKSEELDQDKMISITPFDGDKSSGLWVSVDRFDVCSHVAKITPKQLRREGETLKKEVNINFVCRSCKKDLLMSIIEEDNKNVIRWYEFIKNEGMREIK